MKPVFAAPVLTPVISRTSSGFCPHCWAVITCQLLSMKALNHGQGDETGQKGLQLTLRCQTTTCSENLPKGDRMTVRT